GGGAEGVGELGEEWVGHDDLDLDLREEIDRVLAATIQLGVALLTAEAPHLVHGHADHADAGERLLDVVQLERLDDRLDLLHQILPFADDKATDVPRWPWLKGAISGEGAESAGRPAAQTSGNRSASAQASSVRRRRLGTALGDVVLAHLGVERRPPQPEQRRRRLLVPARRLERLENRS